MRWDAVDDLLQHHQTFITAAMCKDMSNVSESKLMYHKKAKKCRSNHHYNEIYVKQQKMLHAVDDLFQAISPKRSEILHSFFLPDV